MDGLFDINVEYKFIEKMDSLPDLPHRGYFTLYRTLEAGRWKTMMTVMNNNREPKPFLVVAAESDWKTKLFVSVKYERKTWELRVKREGGRVRARISLEGRKDIKFEVEAVALLNR